jgi:ABC-type amino acid transport substrate-binding protein
MMGDDRVLRVGIDDAAPVPMQMGSPEIGSFQGYEVDLLETIAIRLGCRVEYRRRIWSAIVGELMTSKIDALCSAATITPERAHQVDFCSSHLQIRLALVARDRDRDKVSPRVIGVRRGTTAESYLLRMSPPPDRVVISESNEELYESLRTGDLDGVIDDSPIARHFAACKDGLVYVTSYEGTEAEYAIAVRKGNDQLRLRINAELTKLEADGTLANFRRRWFGAPNLFVG